MNAHQCDTRNWQMQIPRPNKQHTMSKKTNQKVAFGKMSHLGGFQIQKIHFGRILPAFLGNLSNQRQLPSGIYQGKKTSVGLKLKKANNKVSYVTSTSPAAAGKFMHENFQEKEHDSITISNNINALRKAKGKLESLSAEITE